MKLLLDTHIWLWSLLEPGKLKKRVLREMKNPENELWLSAISTWELIMLAEKGRVEIDGEVSAWIQQALGASPIHEAPITHEVALETRNVHLPHRDPADRFIAATARAFGLTLVTADERLLNLRDLAVLPNR